MATAKRSPAKSAAKKPVANKATAKVAAKSSTAAPRGGTEAYQDHFQQDHACGACG